MDVLVTKFCLQYIAAADGTEARFAARVGGDVEQFTNMGSHGNKEKMLQQLTRIQTFGIFSSMVCRLRYVNFFHFFFHLNYES